MRLRIDERGRILLPKALRDGLGFEPNTDLEAVEQADGVLFRRARQVPSMIRIDGLWVHQGAPEAGADWNRVVDAGREDRIARILKA